MTMTLRKYLTVLLLLVAVLLIPLNSFAHEVTSGAATGPSVCCLLLTDCSTDERGEQPDHYPGNNADDCCDCVECCPDATEPAFFCGLRSNISAKQHFHPYTNGHSPEVILAIFVPPQSCSLT